MIFGQQPVVFIKWGIFSPALFPVLLGYLITCINLTNYVDSLYSLLTLFLPYNSNTACLIFKIWLSVIC